MQFIDSHSHLNSDAFDEDRDEVIARMKAAGMAAAMVIACEDDELPKLEALLAEHPGWLFGAWALHPEFPDKPEPTVERIAEICSRPGFAAVGETGLDFYWCKEPLDWQRARFRRHIEAAKAIGKPLIIHARDSEREALEILRDMHAGDVGFVMHCFCGARRRGRGRPRKLHGQPHLQAKRGAARDREGASARKPPARDRLSLHGACAQARQAMRASVRRICRRMSRRTFRR